MCSLVRPKYALWEAEDRQYVSINNPPLHGTSASRWHPRPITPLSGALKDLKRVVMDRK